MNDIPLTDLGILFFLILLSMTGSSYFLEKYQVVKK